MSETEVVRLEKIGKSFFTARLETRALHDVDLVIHEGEFVCITGPSGCGKSTLLTILGLLDTAEHGSYRFRGKRVDSLSSAERAGIRNAQIGFVFQSFNLISDMSVEDNVMLPLTYRKGMKLADMRNRARAVLEKLDMVHRLEHFPSQLSGGQQQRVAIARSLVTDPSIILADEPTGNLDSTNAAAVMGLFDQIHKDGRTICMVTHDPVAARQASREVRMRDGAIEQEPAGLAIARATAAVS
jgi:putative ABC transport system ATP-binding protein